MRRTIPLLAAALLLPTLALVACTDSGTTSASPSVSPSMPSPTTASPSATPHVAHVIAAVRNVPYLSEPEGGKDTNLLDVYAPKDAGPWPVVVLCHGGGETKDGYEGWATRVA